MNTRRIVLRALLVCYIAAVLYITLFRDEVKQRVILEPFWEFHQLIETKRYVHWGMQIGLNIVMFVPFGILMPALFQRFEAFPLTVGTAALFSIAIETTQYLLVCGYTETDDVIHNTFGAVIGFLLYRAFCKRRQSLPLGKSTKIEGINE